MGLQSSVAGDRLLRLPDVEKKTSLGKSTIYRLLNKGEFPKPIKPTATVTAWKESEVDAWIAGLSDEV